MASSCNKDKTTTEKKKKTSRKTKAKDDVLLIPPPKHLCLENDTIKLNPVDIHAEPECGTQHNAASQVKPEEASSATPSSVLNVSFDGDGIGATDTKRGKTKEDKKKEGKNEGKKEGKKKEGKKKKRPLENQAEEDLLLIPPPKIICPESTWLNLADIGQAGLLHMVTHNTASIDPEESTPTPSPVCHVSFDRDGTTKTKDGKTKKSLLDNQAEEESLLTPPLKTLQLEPAWLNLADIEQAGPSFTPTHNSSLIGSPDIDTLEESWRFVFPEHFASDICSLGIEGKWSPLNYEEMMNNQNNEIPMMAFTVTLKSHMLRLLRILQIA